MSGSFYLAFYKVAVWLVVEMGSILYCWILLFLVMAGSYLFVWILGFSSILFVFVWFFVCVDSLQTFQIMFYLFGFKVTRRRLNIRKI